MKTWSLGISEAVDKEKINQHWMDDSDFCCAETLRTSYSGGHKWLRNPNRNGGGMKS